MDKRNHILLCIVSASLALSCSEDAGTSIPGDGLLSFTGQVSKAPASGDIDEDDFGLINSSSDAMFGDITVCKSVEGFPDEISVYRQADGIEGRLEAIPESAPLAWSGYDTGHTFYAWTTPQGETGGVDMAEDDPVVGTAVFGTQKETGLEQFIVSEEGPVTYQDNGVYVRLLFYRPVARIQLTGLTHIDATGSVTQVEQCTITFPNLYSSAVFDACRERSGDGNQGDVWLREGEDGYAAPQKGLVWHWDARDGTDPYDYMLYVHPFVFGQDDGVAGGDQPDELQPGYFIVTAEIGGQTKTYFASLSGLSEPDRLEAGQFMKMQLSVQDGAYGGVGCMIVDWNTEPEGNISHSRPGIYDRQDAEELLALLQEEPVDEAGLARYCDDEGVIRLYCHIDWSGLTGEVAVPEGYVLDAQGYRIILSDAGSVTGNVIGMRP